jgi:hypothetical protein
LADHRNYTTEGANFLIILDIACFVGAHFPNRPTAIELRASTMFLTLDHALALAPKEARVEEIKITSKIKSMGTVHRT